MIFGEMWRTVMRGRPALTRRAVYPKATLKYTRHHLRCSGGVCSLCIFQQANAIIMYTPTLEKRWGAETHGRERKCWGCRVNQHMLEKAGYWGQ